MRQEMLGDLETVCVHKSTRWQTLSADIITPRKVTWKKSKKQNRDQFHDILPTFHNDCIIGFLHS